MLIRDLKDPRAGFLTVTRVKVSKDLETCTVYYSVLGDEKAKRRAASLLDHAAPFVQRETAKGLRLRTAPRLHFEFDESIEGTLQMTSLLDRLGRERAERETREGGAAPEEPEPSAGEDDDSDDDDAEEPS